MTFDDLFPFVMPHVKQCPPDVARFNLRQAAIEFCTRALVWREYQAPVETVEGQTHYAYAPAAGQRVAKALSARLNGLRLSVLDPLTGKSLDGKQETEAYLYGRLDGFELHPAHAAGLPIVTYSAVCPTLTAETIPDSFERYAEQLGRGACSRIMLIPGQPFSMPTRGKDLETRFDDDIGSARTEALRGFARTAPRTQASWF